MGGIDGCTVVGRVDRRRDFRVRRGEIWLVDFEPTRGSEASKQRPAVIVSNDGANAAAARNSSGVITVIPLTTNTKKVYAFQTLLAERETGLREMSKAQAEQVRSVAASRLIHRLGVVPASSMNRVDSALRTHLKL